MSKSSMSRRTLFGAGALAGASLVPAIAGAQTGDTANEAVVRSWYKLWVDSRDWAQFSAMMTDDFTFTAASGEDHISKATFKTRCWDNQSGQIKGFDLTAMAENGDQVFAKYLCHTVGGNSFRNVELIRVRNGKIASIECYFGSTLGYPTAVDSKKT